jgi:molybdopterin/thiamine biosynthesis adenylyltransferase
VSERLRAKKNDALEAAYAELASLGFSQKGDGWLGEVSLDCGPTPAKLTIPATFPATLPTVAVSPNDLPKRIPHLERDGKVCVAPSKGVLVDTTRPRAVVRECLDRATRTINAGLSGERDEEFQEEFSAYWAGGAGRVVLSICDLGRRGSRQILWMEMEGRGRGASELVAADERPQGEAWARSGTKVARSSAGFLVELERGFTPPDFDEVLRNGSVLSLLGEHSSGADRHALNMWLRAARLPASILFSIPVPASGDSRFLGGVEVRVPTGKAGEAAEAGFRRGHAPALLVAKRTPKSAAVRLAVERYDRLALVDRGGGEAALCSTTVCVVGCGAVGSKVARLLCQLGVGELRLVDRERFRVENVHRHELGVESVGEWKAEALEATLSSAYPHLRVVSRHGDVLSLVESDLGFLIDVDELVLATGEVTLELVLNEALGDSVPRVHVWVEPLGIGGHAFAAGREGACYRCLFGSSGDHAFTNLSAFAEPGQKFVEAMAGCSGAFVRFSALDAGRSAEEAVRLVVRRLRGGIPRSTLVSWRGNPEAFVDAGFRMSRRAALVAIGSRHEQEPDKVGHCRECSGRA